MKTDQMDRPGAEAPSLARKSFVGLMFECCSVYGRLYPNRTGTAFEGRCPRCSRAISIPVGRDGTDARFFRG